MDVAATPPLILLVLVLVLVLVPAPAFLLSSASRQGRQTKNFQFYGKVSNHHVPHDSSLGDEHDSLPRLVEPIQNVTVSVGRDALLACVVDNLRNYKVAWVRVDTQTILSIHHNVITQNPRISLSYTDQRTWYLHIKDVQEIDRGWYMCQVNTDPMRSRQGYLQVVVPPSFVTRETSTDMVVREASNVTLTCKATGYPEPYVMWQREDSKNINYNGESVTVVNGEVLHITKISRLHMGPYLCIAANGVPPRVSTRVLLKVQFPPMLSIPNQLEGAYVGQDVTLECHTEAYPDSINYWTTEHGDMIVSGNYRSVIGDKYEATCKKEGYNQYMKLKIRNVGPKDFGSYKCVAQNSLGGTDGVIKLDEIPTPPTTTHSSHQGSSVKKNDYKRDNRMPSKRPGDDMSERDDHENELPSSGALSLAPTTGPELAVSLCLLLFTHVLLPITCR